jgi:predicted transcriptional regulator
MNEKDFFNKLTIAKGYLLNLGSKFNQSIISILLEKEDGLFVNQIVELTGREQSTVSTALIALKKMNLVIAERYGRKIMYCINKPVYEKYKEFVAQLTQT